MKPVHQHRLPPIKSRFMGSLDLQNWMHIGAMNLIEWLAFASPRSMTGNTFDASARTARWGDWFRPATRVLIGETMLACPKWCSRWKDLFVFRTPGRARRSGHQKL